jgi:hypothetical protein
MILKFRYVQNGNSLSEKCRFQNVSGLVLFGWLVSNGILYLSLFNCTTKNTVLQGSPDQWINEANSLITTIISKLTRNTTLFKNLVKLENLKFT